MTAGDGTIRRALDGLRGLARDRRALARAVLGEGFARELHARRWARGMARCADPARRPFELGLVDRFVSPGDTVLDFGAHGGAWTLPLSVRVGDAGRVHAFEIYPYYAETLSRALALVGARNVTLHAHGVGAADGDVEIALEDEDASTLTGTVHAVGPGERARRTLRVPVRSFDSVAAELPALLGATFAKIDIEGSELALFRGARGLLERARPVLFCEVTKRQCLRHGHTREDVFAYVGAADYVVHVYRPDGSMERVDPTDAERRGGDYLFLPRERMR